jgi:hypothetical protein
MVSGRGGASLLAIGLSAVAAAGADGGFVPARVWKVPLAIDAVDVPERVIARGLPVAMHAVRSKASLAALEQDLAQQFLAAGLYFPPRGAVTTTSGSPQLTALDPDTFIAYTVFLQPNPDGTTTAIFTETYLAEHQRVAAEGVKFAPVFPGAKNVMVTRSEGVDLLHYRTTASADAIDAFNADAMRKAGYARDAKSGARGFRRGGEVLEVTLKPAAGGSTDVLVVHRMAIEAPRDGARETVAPDRGGGR